MEKVYVSQMRQRTVHFEIIYLKSEHLGSMSRESPLPVHPGTVRTTTAKVNSSIGHAWNLLFRHLKDNNQKSK